jgi:hypothetical protein
MNNLEWGAASDQLWSLEPVVNPLPLRLVGKGHRKGAIAVEAIDH